MANHDYLHGMSKSLTVKISLIKVSNSTTANNIHVDGNGSVLTFRCTNIWPGSLITNLGTKSWESWRVMGGKTVRVFLSRQRWAHHLQRSSDCLIFMIFFRVTTLTRMIFAMIELVALCVLKDHREDGVAVKSGRF